jgi:hypothetical protein
MLVLQRFSRISWLRHATGRPGDAASLLEEHLANIHDSIRRDRAMSLRKQASRAKPRAHCPSRASFIQANGTIHTRACVDAVA